MHYLCNVKRIFVYIMCFVMAFGVAAKKKQTIEPGYSWQVSGPLGLRTPSTIDTLYQGYHRQFVPAMTTDAYATTGNFGCAGVDEIFFNREEWSEFQFEDVLSHWLHSADNQRYYNTRVPMTLLGYSWGGGRNSGQDRLKGEFYGNVNKRLQFGAQLDYLYSKGGYDRQALKNFGWGFSSSYIGDRYDMHAMFFSYNSLNHENGGITDDLYISDPAQLQGGDSKIDAKAIPVNLSSAFSRVKGWEFYMNHRYKVGYWQEETVNDTTKRRTYVPVSSFIWTMDYKTNTHKFKNQSATDDAKYFANNYLSMDGTDEETKYWRLRNTFGIDLIEGFKKNAKFGLSAYATHELRRYTQVVDTMLTSQYKPEGLTPFPSFGIDHSKTENLLWVGGQLTKQRGSVLTYSATAQFGLVGPVAGDIDISGVVSTRFRLFGDTVRITGEGFFKNTEAPYLLKNYISNHFAWKNDFGKIRRVRVGGTLDIPHTWTSFSAGVENLQNYVYFNNDALPAQESGSVQVLSLRLKQDLHFRAFNWENSVTYQTSSKEEVLSLPKLAVYSNLYFQFKIARVLHVNLGVDCSYYTRYYAPAYQPATMAFHTQHEKLIGNYPLMNAYADFKLKKTRFFVMYSHLNQGLFGGKEYFSALHHPINPSRFQLGLSVDFAN